MQRYKKDFRTPAWFLTIVLSFLAGSVNAATLATGDWKVNFDNSVAYALGFRVQDQNSKILHHPAFYAGDAKFPDSGDVVTNRISDLMEFQAVYKSNFGFRVSGSAWKDFAYDDTEEIPQAITDFYVNDLGLPASLACAYDNCKFTSHTKKFFEQGAELLDAFVFWNTDVGDYPVYLKAGRFASYWGNAFFFGFSNIAFSQSPIDFIKGFSQPGSEVRELFLPRTQISAAIDISPILSIEAQYFLEYRNMRYPEGGTYLGFFNILFDGPQGNTGFVPGFGNEGIQKAPHKSDNFGVRVLWRPEWAKGDLGFYYREFDEVHPWNAMINPATGNMYNPVPRDASMIAMSYERTFGLISTGWEISHRMDTGLVSAALVSTEAGATGDITNVIANMFVQLGASKFWQAGVLLAELSYTHLDKLTGNPNLYNGVGTANCVHTNPDGSFEAGTWKDGCGTDNSLALAFLFDPQWMQVWPGVDLDMPINYTYGITGNPAYSASSFYPEETNIYSIGLKALIKQKYIASITYSGYHWRPNGTASPFGPSVPESYSGFGGAGPVSLNDRGWLQLQFKVSF